MTVRELIDASLRKIGARAVADTTTVDEYTDCLIALNAMLDNWAAEQFTVPMMVDENFTWAAGFPSRTMGPAGNFATLRPLSIEHAHVRDAQGHDSAPLSILSWEEYQQIQEKSSTGRPQSIVYRATNSVLVTLYAHPVPDASYTIFLDSLKPFAAVAIDDVFALSPEYLRVVIYNLAVEVAADFGENLRADVVAIAARSKKNVRRLHAAEQCTPVALPTGLS